jgi:hypothetical protein
VGPKRVTLQNGEVRWEIRYNDAGRGSVYRRRRFERRDDARSCREVRQYIKRPPVERQFSDRPTRPPRFGQLSEPAPAAHLVEKRLRAILLEEARRGDAALVCLLAYAGPRP